MFILPQSCCTTTLQSLLPSISNPSKKCSTLISASSNLIAPIAKHFTSLVVRVRPNNLQTHREFYENDNDEEIEEDESDEFPWRLRDEKEEEKDYDKDPEFADILGTSLDDPEKARSKMENRLRKKRHRILHTKTGAAKPMKVTFNNFEFTSSYIWLEFYNAPLEKDVSLICDTVRSWHIVGRLGGCNSMNMQSKFRTFGSKLDGRRAKGPKVQNNLKKLPLTVQKLSQSPLDKRPTYDAIQGANATPATFYNIGDLELQDNLARIWVDIGTSEPLLLDILINALTQLSSDYIGIKQVMFGGSEFENWNENLKTEDVGYSVHKI